MPRWTRLNFQFHGSGTVGLSGRSQLVDQNENQNQNHNLGERREVDHLLEPGTMEYMDPILSRSSI